MSHPPPPTSHALRPYRRYPTLYAERKKYLHIQPTLSSGLFRLFDLPGELREHIYKAAFTLPYPIELWPETDDPVASHQSTTANRNLQHFRGKFKKRGMNLKLLRVCKEIRHEATRCWYESNEWRFSGTNGWMIANAFLYTTALSSSLGWQHIQSITLPLPFDFTPVVHPPQVLGVVHPATANRAVLRLAKQIPFSIPSDWSYEGSVADVCAALGKCDKLRELNLVLPGWYDTSTTVQAGIQGMLQRIGTLKGRGVRIRLLKLRSVKTTMAELAVIDTRQRAFVDECRLRGWDVRSARCDRFGRYDIV
jgi:hypothetical protein